MATDTQKLEERVATLEAEAAVKDDTITSLRQEAAKRRIAARDNQIRSHVVEHVLRAHQIKFDPAEYDYSQHGVEDGQVTGDVTYKAAKPKSDGTPPVKPTGGGTSGTLTEEDIYKMSPAEITKRWDDVSKVAFDN